MTIRTRFAPSPTGPLHLGHAFSACVAFDFAVRHEGTFLVRIEDIDQSRSRNIWEQQIFDDLNWLGLQWPEPVMRQSDNMRAYQAALTRLTQMGLLYNCVCTRRDIQAAMSAPQEGTTPIFGPDGPIYPGTCRNAGHQPSPGGATALRLNMAKAVHLLQQQPGGDTLSFYALEDSSLRGVTFDMAEVITQIGDIVIARRDMGTSYHLSVVVDDHAQNITHVVRGEDLFEATKIHVVLQRLLGYETPVYLHHRLIRDELGKRLAKRDDARALATFRSEGKTPLDIRRMVGLV